MVVEQAGRGEPVARGIVTEAGRSLGRLAVAALKGLDGEQLDVSYTGGVFQAGEALLRPFRREIAEFIKTHYPRHVPARLLRFGLRAMWECAAFTEVLQGAARVEAFSAHKLLADVLQRRRDKVLLQMGELAARFAARDVSDVFSRRAMRLMCRLFYPASACQDYVMTNRERRMPRPDEAVTILQRELVRLDVDEDSMYLFMRRQKQLVSLDSVRSRIKAADSLAISLVFFEHFREETRTDFVATFCMLPEQFSDSKERARLRSEESVGAFVNLPVVALFGGKAAVWYRGEYIDADKSVAVAIATWIVYCRDVYKGKLTAYETKSVYSEFFASRFPL
jgi:hypothetical protein